MQRKPDKPSNLYRQGSSNKNVVRVLYVIIVGLLGLIAYQNNYFQNTHDEMLKSTDEDHCDKAGLRGAVTVMGDIAAFINETKRRKDIVEKYKTGEDSSLSRKISKFNMHSIGKKSSRMGQKLLTSLGL